MNLELSFQATPASRHEVTRWDPTVCLGTGAGPQGPDASGGGTQGLDKWIIFMEGSRAVPPMETAVDSSLTAASGSGDLSCTNACEIWASGALFPPGSFSLYMKLQCSPKP